MYYFEDVTEGMALDFEKEYVVTEEEIIEMATRFDPQPFHIDKEVAEKSIFGTLTASSVHVFAMMVAIGTQDTSQKQMKAVSALGFDNMRLKNPARPGDTLKVSMIVTGVRVSNSRPNCGIVQATNTMTNQRGELVMSFDQAFLIERRNKGA